VPGRRHHRAEAIFEREDVLGFALKGAVRSEQLVHARSEQLVQPKGPAQRPHQRVSHVRSGPRVRAATRARARAAVVPEELRREHQHLPVKDKEVTLPR